MMRCRTCTKEAVTKCDHCGEGICRDCIQIVVEKPTDNHVSVYHRETCVPRRHRKNEVVV